MGFWVTSFVFILVGVVASLSARLCFNGGPSKNLFHQTLAIAATICCWMIRTGETTKGFEIRVRASLAEKMERGLRAYAAVLRLVRRLPAEARPYYAKYARENFVNYRVVEHGDAGQLDELFRRAYNHTVWVLKKYSVDESMADELKGICCK